MPTWIIKLLPYGAAAIALVGAVLYIDHRGYERAQDQQKLIDANEAEQKLELQKMLSDQVNKSVEQMQARADLMDSSLLNRIQSLDAKSQTVIQPILTKEISNAPRLSDPDAGITDRMREALNAARALSGGACSTQPPGDDCFSLSGSQQPVGQ